MDLIIYNIMELGFFSRENIIQDFNFISVSEYVHIVSVTLLSNNNYLPRESNEKTIDVWQEELIKQLNEVIDYLKPDMVLVRGVGEFTYNAIDLCIKKMQNYAFVCYLFVGNKGK